MVDERQMTVNGVSYYDYVIEEVILISVCSICFCRLSIELITRKRSLLSLVSFLLHNLDIEWGNCLKRLSIDIIYYKTTSTSDGSKKRYISLLLGSLG